MSLTVTEAQAVNDLLRFVAAAPDASNEKVDEGRALEAAKLLAAHAHKTLSAGLTGKDVSGVIWPRFTNRLAARDARAATEVCLALARHESHGGSIPWPSIERPFRAWREAQP